MTRVTMEQANISKYGAVYSAVYDVLSHEVREEIKTLYSMPKDKDISQEEAEALRTQTVYKLVMSHISRDPKNDDYIISFHDLTV